MADETDVTQADVSAAAIYWVGKKDRETFPEDLEYFRHNWRSLAGMRRCVEAFAAHRLAAEQSKQVLTQAEIDAADREHCFGSLSKHEVYRLGFVAAEQSKQDEIAQARAEALKEAAKVADEFGPPGYAIATAIRALKSKGQADASE